MLWKITEDLHVRRYLLILIYNLLLLFGPALFAFELACYSVVDMRRDVPSNMQTALLLPLLHVVVGFVQHFHIQKLLLCWCMLALLIPMRRCNLSTTFFTR